MDTIFGFIRNRYAAVLGIAVGVLTIGFGAYIDVENLGYTQRFFVEFGYLTIALATAFTGLDVSLEYLIPFALYYRILDGKTRLAKGILGLAWAIDFGSTFFYQFQLALVTRKPIGWLQIASFTLTSITMVAVELIICWALIVLIASAGVLFRGEIPSWLRIKVDDVGLDEETPTATGPSLADRLMSQLARLKKFLPWGKPQYRSAGMPGFVSPSDRRNTT